MPARVREHAEQRYQAGAPFHGAGSALGLTNCARTVVTSACLTDPHAGAELDTSEIAALLYAAGFDGSPIHEERQSAPACLREVTLSAQDVKENQTGGSETHA